MDNDPLKGSRYHCGPKAVEMDSGAEGFSDIRQIIESALKNDHD
jgi:hypothetical protein